MIISIIACMIIRKHPSSSLKPVDPHIEVQKPIEKKEQIEVNPVSKELSEARFPILQPRWPTEDTRITDTRPYLTAINMENVF
jgi:hypothetical protein